MEQSNNMKPRGNGGPKMPRFNMTWLFTICLITMIILFFTGGGDAIGGSAAKEATYTQFKQYVDKGYVLSVVANKTEKHPQNIHQPEIYARCIQYAGKVCRS